LRCPRSRRYAYAFFRLAIEQRVPESQIWLALYVHRRHYHSLEALPEGPLAFDFPSPEELRTGFLQPLADRGFPTFFGWFARFRNTLAYHTVFDTRAETRSLERAVASGRALEGTDGRLFGGAPQPLRPVECMAELPLDDAKFQVRFTPLVGCRLSNACATIAAIACATTDTSAAPPQLGTAPPEFERHMRAFVDVMLQHMVRRPDALRWFCTDQLRGFFRCLYPEALDTQPQTLSWIGALFDHIRTVVTVPGATLTGGVPSQLRDTGVWPSVLAGKVELRLPVASYVPPPEFMGRGARTQRSESGEAVGEPTRGEEKEPRNGKAVRHEDEEKEPRNGKEEEDSEEEEYVAGDEDIDGHLDSGITTPEAKRAQERRKRKRMQQRRPSPRPSPAPAASELIHVAVPPGSHLVIPTPDALGVFFAVVVARLVMPLKFYIEHCCYAAHPMRITHVDPDSGQRVVVPYAQLVPELRPPGRRKAAASASVQVARPRAHSSRRATLDSAWSAFTLTIEGLLGTPRALSETWNQVNLLTAAAQWSADDRRNVARLVATSDVLQRLFDGSDSKTDAFKAQLTAPVYERERAEYFQIYRQRLVNLTMRLLGLAPAPDPVGLQAMPQLIEAAHEYKQATARLLERLDRLEGMCHQRLTPFEAKVRGLVDTWLRDLARSPEDLAHWTRELGTIFSEIRRQLEQHQRDPAACDWLGTDQRPFAEVRAETWRLEHFRHLRVPFSHLERTAMALLHTILVADPALLKPDGTPKSGDDLANEEHPFAKLCQYWSEESREVNWAIDNPVQAPSADDPLYPGQHVWCMSLPEVESEWLTHFSAAVASTWLVAELRGAGQVRLHRAMCLPFADSEPLALPLPLPSSEPAPQDAAAEAEPGAQQPQDMAVDWSELDQLLASH
jgi:hypothetical protein